MTKWQPGDKIKLHSKLSTGWNLKYGEVYTVASRRENDNGVYLEGQDPGCWWWDHRFVSAESPVDEAVKVLEAAGYTVTPPKPKETGTVVVYRYFNGDAYLATKQTYDSWGDKERYPVLAIVAWTEGDGLDKENTNA